MSGKKPEPRRRSARLHRYDYSQPGAYFVTMCVRGRECVLCEIKDGVTHLTAIGNLVQESWLALEQLYEYLELDEWEIMPNHLHGIIFFHEVSTLDIEQGRGGSRTAPTEVLKRKHLGRIVGAFKTISTKRINRFHGTPGEKFWQRGYYDRIVRNRDELNSIRKYIAENPLKWEIDEYHPSRWKT